MGASVYGVGASVYGSLVILVSAQVLLVLTLGLWTSDLGLTIFKLYGVLFWILLKPHLTWVGGGPCDVSVCPSPFGLDFENLDLDFGLSHKFLRVLGRRVEELGTPH